MQAVQRKRAIATKSQVLSATRLHFPGGTSSVPQVSVQHLRSYAVSTQELGVAAAIAVNCLETEITAIISEAAPRLDFAVLHVPVWGAFVPALNTLLGEAQRRHLRYILYQSLEVHCNAVVLERLVNHFTHDTLVVGPVLQGHEFADGEQPLNGRTSPWNTLALWSTRKLGLTGFLSIADGLPSTVRKFSRMCSGGPDMGPDMEEISPYLPMGSEDWWLRQATIGIDDAGIPAGVEEVTAIALLQHLLTEHRARAVLVKLSSDLEASITWTTSWAGDARREAWHKQKMASKVARPAKQLQLLFKKSKMTSLFSLRQPLISQTSGFSTDEDAAPDSSNQWFGVVHHYGESIRVPWHVEFLCFSAVALYFVNFSARFASLFQLLNEGLTMEGLIFIVMQFCALCVPLPVSLYLIRYCYFKFDHIGGFTFVAALLGLSNGFLVIWQLSVGTYMREEVLVGACLVQGLASGVAFHTRFVLSAISTCDHHNDLLIKTLLTTEASLAAGALLPCVASKCLGQNELIAAAPELAPSLVLAMLSLGLLVGLAVKFPRRLHHLPYKVRFPETYFKSSVIPLDGTRWNLKMSLLISGTTRIFVQFAVVVTIAIRMRQADIYGEFRQTQAAAAAFALLACTDGFLSALRRSTLMPHWFCARSTVIVVVATIVCVVLAEYVCTELIWGRSAWSGIVGVVVSACECAALLFALCFAAPQFEVVLSKSDDSERMIVLLEWLKAYLGRLLGPVIAFSVAGFCGYGTMLVLLCSATFLVAITA